MSATRIRELRAARIRLGFAPALTELPPPIRKAIEQDHKEGLGWRHDGLSGGSTEDDIFRRLQELSVDTDPTRFREQAAQSGGVVTLAASWSTSTEPTGPWADFPLLAAEELWFRLLPEIECAEVVSRRLDEAVLASSPENIRIPTGETERHDLRSAMAEFLGYVSRGNPETCPARYAEAQACSPIDYEGTLLELIKKANGTELDDVAELAANLSGAKPNPLTLGYLGMAFARAGRSDEARSAVDKNLARFPGSAWAYETAGEVNLILGQAGPAIDCFRSALQHSQTALDWAALLDHMCTAVASLAPDPTEESSLSAALDRLAEEFPPPDD